MNEYNHPSWRETGRDQSVLDAASLDANTRLLVVHEDPFTAREIATAISALMNVRCDVLHVGGKLASLEKSFERVLLHEGIFNSENADFLMALRHYLPAAEFHLFGHRQSECSLLARFSSFIECGFRPRSKSAASLKNIARKNSAISCDDGFSRLSPRETLVLEYISQGMKNNEVALKMAVSPQTISSFVSRICEKLNVSRRQDLIFMKWKHDDQNR